MRATPSVDLFFITPLLVHAITLDREQKLGIVYIMDVMKGTELILSLLVVPVCN